MNCSYQDLFRKPRAESYKPILELNATDPIFERMHTACMSLKDLILEYDSIEDHTERILAINRDIVIRLSYGLDETGLMAIREGYEKRKRSDLLESGSVNK